MLFMVFSDDPTTAYMDLTGDKASGNNPDREPEKEKPGKYACHVGLRFP